MMQGNEGQASKVQPRINVWRLGKNMLLALVFPCTAAVIVDKIVGTWPILTLAVAGFAFPIAGFLVTRSALRELQRVIQEVAPVESAQPEAGDTHADDGASPPQ